MHNLVTYPQIAQSAVLHKKIIYRFWTFASQIFNNPAVNLKFIAVKTEKNTNSFM